MWAQMSGKFLKKCRENIGTKVSKVLAQILSQMSGKYWHKFGKMLAQMLPQMS